MANKNKAMEGLIKNIAKVINEFNNQLLREKIKTGIAKAKKRKALINNKK